MRKEPIRHHYIPQFILRNFACDDCRKLVCYYDKENQTVSKREICEIFMERNLYRDEINYVQEPVQIEYDLAKYESEVSKIIREKFLDDCKIELTSREDNMLKLFFAIMSYRSIVAKEQFTNRLTDKSKNIYKNYQKNENFEDLWKRNLGYLARCRTMNDVMKHPEIDIPIKLFMQRDINGLYGKYFVVVEAKEETSFILGDCYPVVIFGDNMNIVMYEIFPISPKRAILLASVGVEATPSTVLTLRKGVFDMPQINENGDIVIRRKRILPEEVYYLNTEIENNSHKGFIFFEPYKIFKTGE